MATLLGKQICTKTLTMLNYTVIQLKLSSSQSALQGLSRDAAERKWADMFADASVRRDQKDAVNREGHPIGKARRTCLFMTESVKHVIVASGVAVVGCLSSARKRQTKLTRTEFQRMCFSFMFCLLGSGSVFFGFLFGLVWRVTCDFEKGGAGGACRTGQRHVATEPRPDS